MLGMSEEVAKRIKFAREQAELSPTQVHELLGVSRSTVYDWEKDGQIKEEHLVAFCELVHEEPAYIRYMLRDTAAPAIDRKRMQTCIDAIKAAADKNNITLNEDQILSAAIHLYEGHDLSPREAARTVTLLA